MNIFVHEKFQIYGIFKPFSYVCILCNKYIYFAWWLALGFLYVYNAHPSTLKNNLWVKGLMYKSISCFTTIEKHYIIL